MKYGIVSHAFHGIIMVCVAVSMMGTLCTAFMSLGGASIGNLILYLYIDASRFRDGSIMMTFWRRGVKLTFLSNGVD